MAEQQQLSLFPSRETLEQVVQEGIAMLPITNPNQLIALLNMQANTIHKQLEIRRWTTSSNG